VRKLKRRGRLIPAWEMPSDPVKAVFWFIHWFLKVLVRFFWLLILAGVIYESVVNGVVGGVVTLLVGLGVWSGLAAALFIFNAAARVSHTVEDVSRLQRGFSSHRKDIFSNLDPDIDDSKVVEGSVTDLDEERRKRRRE
jgi:hypothetical protein